MSVTKYAEYNEHAKNEKDGLKKKKTEENLHMISW